jgi:hypothetical protein
MNDMSKLERYNEYCLLVSRLDTKQEELREVTMRKGKVEYEVASIEKRLKDYSDISDMTGDDVLAIQRLRMQTCLDSAVHFDDGGSVGGVPVKDFKSSSRFKDLDKNQKKLFTLVEPQLTHSQYNIQNAIIIANEGSDSEDFDVYSSTVIESFIDEIMEQSEVYETLGVNDLKQVKEIIYIFVEHVSKF